MRAIEMRAIPHGEQRYETVGDYWTDATGVEQFRVSQMADERYEHLVLLHELVERILCYHRGVKNETIDAFDMQYEKAREAQMLPDEDEPGDDPKAPYYKEHQVATAIERLLAVELGVDWNEYNRAVMEAT